MYAHYSWVSWSPVVSLAAAFLTGGILGRWLARRRRAGRVPLIERALWAVVCVGVPALMVGSFAASYKTLVEFARPTLHDFAPVGVLTLDAGIAVLSALHVLLRRKRKRVWIIPVLARVAIGGTLWLNATAGVTLRDHILHAVLPTFYAGLVEAGAQLAGPDRAGQERSAPAWGMGPQVDPRGVGGPRRPEGDGDVLRGHYGRPPGGGVDRARRILGVAIVDCGRLETGLVPPEQARVEPGRAG